MHDPFWQSAKILLSYKRPLVIALFGALVSAACFGAGIGTLMLAVTALLQEKKSVGEIIREIFVRPNRSEIVQNMANRLAELVPADPFPAFVLVMVVITAMTVIGNSGRFLHEMFTLTVVQHATMAWRGRMLRRLVSVPIIELMRTGTADHISRVVFDTRPLARAYRAILGKTVEQVLCGGVAVVIAFWIDWPLTLIAIIVAPPLMVLLRKFGRRIRRAARRALRQRGRMVAALKEAMGGIRVVKVHNAEGFERRRFAVVNRGLFREEMKIRTVRALASPVIDCLGFLAVAMVASLAAYSVYLRDEVDSARFILVLGCLGGAATTLKPLANLNSHINEGRAAATRIMGLLALPVESAATESQRELPALPHHARSIAFEGVTFGYPDQEPPAVQEVSLEVAFGQTIAIVGGNGSGKTTLLSLLPRLLEPQSGRILIDGFDISRVCLRSLRRQMAVVTQDSVVFEATLAENIAYGRRHVPLDRILAAAKAAYADDFIRELPQGYDTMLGEQGMGLSGGQRQRLCIARAILRDPSILILDEATSQIDAESEARIRQALRNFRRGRTVFVVAHRLSTVIDADCIVVMDGGRIVDQGDHENLLSRCEHYRTLTRTQLHPPVA